MLVSGYGESPSPKSGERTDVGRTRHRGGGSESRENVNRELWTGPHWAEVTGEGRSQDPDKDVESPV